MRDAILDLNISKPVERIPNYQLFVYWVKIMSSESIEGKLFPLGVALWEAKHLNP